MWSYNYNNESFLSHAKDYKYIKKEKRPTYTRYYYSSSSSRKHNKKAKEDEVPDVSPDMERVAYGLGGGEYHKDKQDLEYERNHAAGKDKRTYDEYMDDKIKAYKSSNNKREEKQAAKSRSNISDAELKKERRKDLVNLGKSVMSYYF